MAESKEKLKSLLMRVMEELERAGLKLNIQQTNKQTNNSDHDIWPHYFLANRKVEVVTGFPFLGSKITANSEYNHEIIR